MFNDFRPSNGAPALTDRALTRRHALGAIAGAAGAVPLLAACGGGDSAADGGAGAPSGTALGATGDVAVGSGTIYADQNVVVTQPTKGDFKCFGATCTHQGCQVSGVTETIDCSCHGSKFSIEDGSVVQGPATAPLTEQKIDVKGDEITLA
jgi:nitrite reductase/ring-hydroxylating ferredoxin subunit